MGGGGGEGPLPAGGFASGGGAVLGGGVAVWTGCPPAPLPARF
eukprot:COSAG02_NODE_8347_length_2603_cov_1.735224_5_plen_42_part_01